MPLVGYRKHYVEAIHMTHLARYCPAWSLYPCLVTMHVTSNWLSKLVCNLIILLGFEIHYNVSYYLLCMDNQLPKLCVIGNCLAMKLLASIHNNKCVNLVLSPSVFVTNSCLSQK